VDPLAASATAQSQSMVQNQVAVAMLKKSVDLMAQQGADMVQLMAQAQQTGVGQQVNLYA
jgi:Putative motility protein